MLSAGSRWAFNFYLFIFVGRFWGKYYACSFIRDGAPLKNESWSLFGGNGRRVDCSVSP